MRVSGVEASVTSSGKHIYYRPHSFYFIYDRNIYIYFLSCVYTLYQVTLITLNKDISKNSIIISRV